MHKSFFYFLCSIFIYSPVHHQNFWHANIVCETSNDDEEECEEEEEKSISLRLRLLFSLSLSTPGFTLSNTCFPSTNLMLAEELVMIVTEKQW
jgi:hypothetical protein